jgi:hypothetical protein
MDLVLEGIDASDVSFILEASQAFNDGHKTVLETIKQFISVLEEAQHSGQLDAIVEKIKGFGKDLEAIDLKTIPEKFSFKANAELYAPAEDKGSAGIQALTTIAASFDSYYSGTKDAIIAIAKELENFKDVFSVGSNGILLTKAFAKTDKIEDDLTLMHFLDMTPPQIATFLATGKEGEDDEWKEVFSEELAAIAGKLGDPIEKADDAIKEFLDMLELIGNSIRQLADQVAKNLADTKPNPEIQTAIKKEGFLTSLFKKSNPYDIDIKVAQVLTEALLKLPLTNFWKLTQGLIQMTKDADAALKGAIIGTKDQADKITEVPKEAAKFKKKLNDILPTDTDKANKIAQGIEELGKNTGVKEDSYKLDEFDVEDLKALLASENLDDNTTEKFENEFDVELEPAEESIEPKVMKKSDWDEKVGEDAKIAIGKESAELLANTLIDMGKVKFESANALISLLNEGIIDDVVAAIESNSEADDRLKQSLIKKLKNNKNNIASYIEEEFGTNEGFTKENQAANLLIYRWAVLASIIKG